MWTRISLSIFIIFVCVSGCCDAPRPEDTTDPGVFAGNGAELDYCVITDLDGDGLTADDIPKAYTPGDGWEAFPMPVLVECREPLDDDAADLRGLWFFSYGNSTHVERIEQCGNRVVITSGGVIHDMRTDGTLANGVNDISGVESIQGCRIRVSATWEDGALVFHPWGLGTAVRRIIVDGQLALTHFALGTTILGDRICYVP
jgi:hypothetical protein